jgi:hypothetical protein
MDMHKTPSIQLLREIATVRRLTGNPSSAALLLVINYGQIRGKCVYKLECGICDRNAVRLGAKFISYLEPASISMLSKENFVPLLRCFDNKAYNKIPRTAVGCENHVHHSS